MYVFIPVLLKQIPPLLITLWYTQDNVLIMINKDSFKCFYFIYTFHSIGLQYSD